ncbi:MAG: mechanosensitive ion channel family protein [Deferribacterales bacterium]
MSVSSKTSDFLTTLSDASSVCLARLVQHISENPSIFAFTLACAVIGYIIINVYKLKLTRKHVNERMQIFVHVLFPFMFVIFSYYSIRTRQQDPLYLMLNYFAFYWLAGAILKIPSRFLNISVKRCYSTVMWYILAALLLAVYYDLLKLYGADYKHGLKSFMHFLSGLIRLFLSLGFYIYLKKMLPALMAHIAEKGRIPGIFRIPPGFLITAFGVISFLWVVDVLRLDFRFIMTAGLLVLAAALLSQLSSNVNSVALKIYTQENYTQFEWELIKKNIIRLAVAASIYIFYSLGYNVLDIAELMHTLKKTYLINSELFRLSLASLLSAVLIFILLKSLLFLSSKYLRVAVFGGVQTSDSGSLEVLLSNIGILIIIIITMLVTGITWKIVVPIAGALGIGLGFGLQTIINNYISGFILLFSKKVKIGDYVELPGTAGRAVGVTSDTVFGAVSSIDMFATTVRTFDNIEIMVPNSVFISETIINYTRNDNLIRVRIPIGVGYSSDIELAQRLMLETIRQCDSVLKDKEPEVWFMEYGESSVNFLVLFWLDTSKGFQTVAVKNVFLQSLWQKFKEHGIEIPFPQQDVWFRNTLITENKEKQ